MPIAPHIAALAAAAVVSAAVSAGAQEAGAGGRPAVLTVAFGADLAASNTYVWRGFEAVHAPSLQPSLWLTAGDLTVSSWLNLSTGRPNGQMLVEHDLLVDYSRSAGQFVWSVGWINYVFPDVQEGRFSNEFYGGVAWDGALRPSVTVYQDVHEGTGTYICAAVAHEMTLSASGITLTPSLSVGYNHYQWIDASTWSDAVAGLELSIPLPGTPAAVVTVVNYSKGLAPGLFGDHFYAAVGVSASWDAPRRPD